ncbi:MAG: phosphate acyltransferase PlsX [Chloroflexi bacterium]|nr:phosphate acyltransferase PlsX [Chloroflexota bacterium]
MKIALDAMGGDHAPGEIVRGALDAATLLGVEVALVGGKHFLEVELARYSSPPDAITIVDAPQVVVMEESPINALRQKPKSSIMVGLDLVKAGKAAAFVTAGNTGATMAAALMVLGRIEGVERPALGSVLATPAGPTLLLDVGANADCKPSFFPEFARLGKAYMERVFGIADTRIALLSNGEEYVKGNHLVREAHELLKQAPINFLGNIESKDIPRGVAHVVISDGFTGNIVIKLLEGVSETFMDILNQALSLQFPAATSPLHNLWQEVERRLDYAEYGGAPLLGVNGVVVIAHGRSNAKAVKNAIRVAKQEVEKDMLEALRGARI